LREKETGVRERSQTIAPGIASLWREREREREGEGERERRAETEIN